LWQVRYALRLIKITVNMPVNPYSYCHLHLFTSLSNQSPK
jgi:hypothetical protein